MKFSLQIENKNSVFKIIFEDEFENVFKIYIQVLLNRNKIS